MLIPGSSRAVFSGLALFAIATCLGPQAVAKDESGPPRLVLQITIDQLRGEPHQRDDEQLARERTGALQFFERQRRLEQEQAPPPAPEAEAAKALVLARRQLERADAAGAILFVTDTFRAPDLAALEEHRRARGVPVHVLAVGADPTAAAAA